MNPSTDAFFLALAIASFVVNSLSAATQHAAVPFLVMHQRQGSAERFLSELSGLSLMAATAMAAVMVLGVHLMLPHLVGFTVGQSVLAERLVWGLIPFVLFSVLGSLWVGAMNANGAYLTPPLSLGLRHTIILGAVLLMASRFGIYVLLGAYVLGELVRVGFLGYSLARQQPWRLSVQMARPSAEVMEFLKSGMAQVAGSATLGATPVIDRLMASWLEPGSISVLDYAERLWQVPLSLVMSGLLVVSLSQWSQAMYGGGSARSLSEDTRRLAGLLFAFSVPVAISVAYYRHGLVEVIFAHGRFASRDLPRLGDTLAVFALGLPVYLVGLVYTRALLVLRRSDLLFRVSVAQVLVKIVFNAAWMGRWGVVGIALSTSAMYALASLALLMTYRRHRVLDGARQTSEVPPADATPEGPRGESRRYRSPWP